MHQIYLTIYFNSRLALVPNLSEKDYQTMSNQLKTVGHGASGHGIEKYLHQLGYGKLWSANGK